MSTTLNLNEIEARAAEFAAKYKDAAGQEAEPRTFQNDFLQVLGIDQQRVALFEEKVQRADGSAVNLDLFWPGHILIGLKSRGGDRRKAYEQARRYALTLKPGEMPRAILICDIEHWDFYDLERDEEQISFTLAELPQFIWLFDFLAGYDRREFEEEVVNLRAAELLGELHGRLKAAGYTGHALEAYLLRLLFCLFADDTGIFERDHFLNYLRGCTAEDGRDLAPQLAEWFRVLNTPEEQRFCPRNALLSSLPYVGGGLFAEQLPMPVFDAGMRGILLECCRLDWGRISPAVFGSMFQGVIKPGERRAPGAHHAGEHHILKLITPLFLDSLCDEFDEICADRSTRRRARLLEFHRKLAGLRFLDPACGCGNFLVIAYRELRLLELELIRELESTGRQVHDISELCRVSVEQFYGIEIEEFPAQMARVAMWLMEHQMNIEVGRHFGRYLARIPLRAGATIVCGNALRLDWEELVPGGQLSYILGNPPLAGTRTAAQKEEIRELFHRARAGYPDYGACWHMKAARLMQAHPRVRTAFASSDSITRGGQVRTLWEHLLPLGMEINFAYRAFKWNRDAGERPAVHCVIMGFSAVHTPLCTIYAEDTKGKEQIYICESINGYLAAGVNEPVKGLSRPLYAPLDMISGNKPADGGHLILTAAERRELLSAAPGLADYVRPYFGAQDYLNHIPAGGEAERYCLWLKNMPLSEMLKHPPVMQRVLSVREMRLAGKAPSTREYAQRAHLFHRITQTRDEACLLVPGTGCGQFDYVPIGFMPAGCIMADSTCIVPGAGVYEFGILSSRMHMVWMKALCGRHEMRCRYNRNLCYNTFYWPEYATTHQMSRITQAAEHVLQVRARFEDCSPATLYTPETMPHELLLAHRKLDSAVDLAYGHRFADDAEREAFLFEKYRTATW